MGPVNNVQDPLEKHLSQKTRLKKKKKKRRRRRVIIGIQTDT